MVSIRTADGDATQIQEALELAERLRAIAAIEDPADQRRALLDAADDLVSNAHLREHAPDAIAQVSAGVAHDLNNVLMTVAFNVYEVRQGLEPDARHLFREAFASIDAAARAGSALLRGLIRFVRGQRSHELAQIDLAAVIHEHLPLLRSVLGSRIQLDCDLQPVGRVVANRGLIGQILLNLAANARDAQPNTWFSLRLDCVKLEDDVLPDGEYVRLTARDRGPGMSREIAAHALDAYFTTRRGKGTGIGLATVHAIARDLRGGLRLMSAPGTGTTVEVLLPVCQNTTSPAPP